jgi:hypothetical protein
MAEVTAVETKAFYASQTFWGAVAALGAGLGGAYAAWKVGNIDGAMTALVAAGGALVAIVGRFKAVKPLK